MEKDDVFWLNAGLICFSALMAYIFWRAAETVGIHMGWLERFEWYNYLSMGVAFVGGGLSGYLMQRDKERYEFLLASVGEVRKVTWPSAEDTRKMTIIVCVVVGFFAVILALFDFSWSYLFNKFLLS